MSFNAGAVTRKQCHFCTRALRWIKLCLPDVATLRRYEAAFASIFLCLNGELYELRSIASPSVIPEAALRLSGIATGAGVRNDPG
jgi:hypothetical protein